MAEVTALRNNALNYPVYGAPYGVVIPLLDADGDLVTGATTPDSEISKNGDTFADCTNEMVEIATASGMYYLLLTATEMTADVVTLILKSATAGMKTTPVVLYPRKLVTIRSGTSASAGSATGTIVLDASASLIDDFYNSMVVIATIDSNVEARVISDYVGSTQTASVVPDWNVAPDNNDTFVIKLTEGAQVVQANTTHISNTLQTAGDIIGDTNDIQARLPAALVSGRIDASVGAMAANVLTATAIDADAITDAKVASDVTIASVTGAVGSVTGAVGSVASGGITSASFAASAINAAAIATDAITAAKIAADAITAAKIADGAIDAATFAAGAINAAAIAADAITDAKVASDVTIASVTGAVGSVTGAVGSVTGAVGSVASGGITAASFAADAITAAKLHADVTTELQAGLATQTSVDDLPTNAELATALGTADDAVLAQVALVKAKTDNLPTDPADQSLIIAATDAIVSNIATVDTVVDAILAMLDDPRGEPAQGAPPVNPDLATKVDYIFKFLRNKKTQGATTLSVFADDGTTVDHKATISDDGTTYTHGEVVSGP